MFETVQVAEDRQLALKQRAIDPDAKLLGIISTPIHMTSSAGAEIQWSACKMPFSF
jgi:hypothetical protein